MDIKNYLRLSFDLQFKLNSFLNERWYEIRLIDVDWVNATLDECSELLNSLNWKWWKGKEELYSLKDKKNVLLELVDIYHFLLSFIIQLAYKKYEKKSREKFFDEVIESFLEVKKTKNKKEDKTGGFRLLHLFLKNFIEESYSWENIYIPKKSIDSFLELLYYFDYDLKDLLKLYIGKVFLNEYRQIRGYKDGSYKKIWKNGKEDNENLMEILEELSLEELKKEKLFELFDKRY